MKAKFLSIVTILALMFSVILPLSATASTSFDTARYGDVLDIGPYLRHQASDPDLRAALDDQIKEAAKELNLNAKNQKPSKKTRNDSSVTATSESADSAFTYDGGTKYFTAYDNGGYYLKTYTLRSLGENVEVWVADNLSFSDGDPRDEHIVTQEQVDLLRDEFDNNIYQVDTEFFGTPDSHTGENSLLVGWGYFPEGYYAPVDGKERVIMLVDNIRDESYYNSTYPFFIAGFYSSTVEGYIDRNIINLDTNSWETRLESTFFGTTAHEFQHLIHDDNDPSEESWLNEGMSDFAEYLAGYGHAWGHVNFFLDHPENSLIEWDDHYSAETGPETLADYGQAYLLQLYLNDKYGSDFIQALAKDTDQGIASVNHVLDQFNTGIDFTELFKRFTVALAIDSYAPGDGIYEFDSIDLKVNYESALTFDKDGVPAWGGDYKQLDFTDKILNISFDGIDFLPINWMVIDDPLGSGEKVFWGNEGHGIDNMLIFEADLTGVEAATLQFDHILDIEEDWDAGVVQVSTDGGATWTSLANENTVDQDTFPLNEQAPQIYNNLPGFTGYTDGWQNETFDLTPYAGQNVMINFRYMTDAAYNDTGWFIDNITIPEIGYFNDASSLDGFSSLDEIQKNYVEYAVSFINERTAGNSEDGPFYRVVNVDPFNVTEEDALQLRQLFKDGNNYMIIWYAAPVGTKGTVDFTYDIMLKDNSPK